MKINSVLFWCYHDFRNLRFGFHIGELEPEVDKELAEFLNNPEDDLD